MDGHSVHSERTHSTQSILSAVAFVEISLAPSVGRPLSSDLETVT